MCGGDKKLWPLEQEEFVWVITEENLIRGVALGPMGQRLHYILVILKRALYRQTDRQTDLHRHTSLH